MLLLIDTVLLIYTVLIKISAKNHKIIKIKEKKFLSIAKSFKIIADEHKLLADQYHILASMHQNLSIMYLDLSVQFEFNEKH